MRRHQLSDIFRANISLIPAAVVGAVVVLGVMVAGGGSARPEETFILGYVAMWPV